MRPDFNIGSVWSVSDLLADLSACRQLRHVPREEIAAFAEDFFEQRKPRIFVRVAEAFEAAFRAHGYCCDLCDETIDVDFDNAARRTADRAIENLDGTTKLLTCYRCGWRFKQFTRRYFGREVRTKFCDELEQLMLAYVAWELLRAVRREKYEQTSTRNGRENRRDDAAFYDRPANSRGDRAQPKHNSQIPAVALSRGGIPL